LINPCLITPDNGGQEIVTLTLVTSKQLGADGFCLLRVLFGKFSRDPSGTDL
jgi:hypothetical protein